MKENGEWSEGEKMGRWRTKGSNLWVIENMKVIENGKVMENGKVIENGK